jgi:hypothetical protein
MTIRACLPRALAKSRGRTTNPYAYFESCLTVRSPLEEMSCAVLVFCTTSSKVERFSEQVLPSLLFASPVTCATVYVPHKDSYAEKTYHTSLAQDDGVEPAVRTVIVMERNVDFALSKPPTTKDNATARSSNDMRTYRTQYMSHTDLLHSEMESFPCPQPEHC